MTNVKTQFSKLLKMGFAIFALTCLSILPVNKANASSEDRVCTGSVSACPGCSGFHEETRRVVKEFIDEDIETHKEWLINDFWKNAMLPALQGQAEQDTADMLESVKQESTIATAEAEARNVNEARGHVTEAMQEAVVTDNMCRTVSTAADMLRAEGDADYVETVMSNISVQSGLGTTGTGTETTGNRNRTMDTMLCASADLINTPYIRERCEGVETEQIAASFTDVLSGNSPITLEPNGRPTPASTTLQYINSVMVPRRPDVTAEQLYSEDGTVTTSQIAYQNLRSPLAQALVANRCLNGSLSDRFTTETELNDQMRALATEYNIVSPERLEQLGNSPRAQMDLIIGYVNSPDKQIEDNGENLSDVMRYASYLEALRTSYLYDMLEAAHCEEMLSAIHVANSYEPVRNQARRAVQEANLRYENQKDATKFAEK